MRKRLVGLLGSTMIVLSACQGAASPSPSSPVTSAPPASSGPTPSEPAASASEAPVDLTNTAYAPEDGKDGGTIIIGDWQEAKQLNPFSAGQATEGKRAPARCASI